MPWFRDKNKSIVFHGCFSLRLVRSVLLARAKSGVKKSDIDFDFFLSLSVCICFSASVGLRLSVSLLYCLIIVYVVCRDEPAMRRSSLEGKLIRLFPILSAGLR